MTEIIPDTSKYTDLPNKLRAFALFAESKEPAEYQMRSGRWVTYDRPGMLDASARFLANGEHEYRIKPKPRELWAVYGPGGVRTITTDRHAAAVGYASDYEGSTVVHFVEQPE